jgi:hypothetical protein
MLQTETINKNKTIKNKQIVLTSSIFVVLIEFLFFLIKKNEIFPKKQNNGKKDTIQTIVLFLSKTNKLFIKVSTKVVTTTAIVVKW